MGNDCPPSVDGLDWQNILAQLDRNGVGHPDWGAPGAGPSTTGSTTAHHQAGQGGGSSTDVLAHLVHNLHPQQMYSGFSPEYLALLQQQLASGGPVPSLETHGLQQHPPLNQSPQTYHNVQLPPAQPPTGAGSRPQSRTHTPRSSQAGSTRNSMSGSGTPSTTPPQSNTPLHTPIAPAPPAGQFSAAPNGAPTPTGRPPPRAQTGSGSTSGPSTTVPTPVADDTEDKRIRNTLASARFRAKKKAHVENVERNIRALEAQHSELEVQVADLRKENGLLKEMVQLKYGGVKHS